MKIHLLKRLLYVFLISGIWVTVPLTILYYPPLKGQFVELGEKLTQYSVEVQGYYRGDGTYIPSHSRRPPGSVERDKPIEEERSERKTGMYFLLAGCSISTLILFRFGIPEITDRKQNYHKKLFNKIITKVNFNYSQLKDKPPNLINRNISRYNTYKTYSCIRCRRKINYNEFHWSNLAKRQPYKICYGCMYIEPSNKFEGSLKYIFLYKEKLSYFLSNFKRLNEQIAPNFIIKDSPIVEHFNGEIKKIRR